MKTYLVLVTWILCASASTIHERRNAVEVKDDSETSVDVSNFREIRDVAHLNRTYLPPLPTREYLPPYESPKDKVLPEVSREYLPPLKDVPHVEVSESGSRDSMVSASEKLKEDATEVPLGKTKAPTEKPRSDGPAFLTETPTTVGPIIAPVSAGSVIAPVPKQEGLLSFAQKESPLQTTNSPIQKNEKPLPLTKVPVPVTEALLVPTKAPLAATESPLASTETPAVFTETSTLPAESFETSTETLKFNSLTTKNFNETTEITTSETPLESFSTTLANEERNAEDQPVRIQLTEEIESGVLKEDGYHYKRPAIVPDLGPLPISFEPLPIEQEQQKECDPQLHANEFQQSSDPQDTVANFVVSEINQGLLSAPAVTVIEMMPQDYNYLNAPALTNDYLPPSHENQIVDSPVEEMIILTDNGYHFQTSKRFRF